MKHIVIGTAGHVDHGKTVLVKALTGVDTDRLKEEKKRGISIELGFAQFKLPSGLKTSIIDVPGHERFIKNMLAGVGGIDLVMLVVAADEGVMPQTSEHLDIISLLQIKKGVTVITKTDLVDEEWLGLVEDDLRAALQGSVLEEAPLVTVSAATGENLDLLRSTLDELAAEIEVKQSLGLPRLPIDRVFSVVGFGTVVTGTLLTGQIKIGDNMQIYPAGDIYRVRNLHVYGQKVELAQAGQRVAVNLTGAEKSDIDRGFVLGAPESLKPTHRLDVKLKYLSNASKPLQHRTRIRVHLGTMETMGRVLLLDRDKLEPGAETYVQLQLENTVAAARGDRFVIRSYSPMRTVGGGVIVDPAPLRHRRYRSQVLEALATAEKGTPEQLLEQHLQITAQVLTVEAMSKDMGLDQDVTKAGLDRLLKNNLVIKLSADNDERFLAARTIHDLTEKILAALTDYHRLYPLRSGYPKEEIRSRYFTHLEGKSFQMLINHWEKNGSVVVKGKDVALGDFEPMPPAALQRKINMLEQIFMESACQPPAWEDAANRVDLADDVQAAELLNYLLRRGVLVKLTTGIYLHRSVLQQAMELIRQHLREKGEMTLGDVRDLLQTSRKYTLPFLDYLDQERITRRVGDLRVPGKLL